MLLHHLFAYRKYCLVFQPTSSKLATERVSSTSSIQLHKVMSPSSSPLLSSPASPMIAERQNASLSPLEVKTEPEKIKESSLSPTQLKSVNQIPDPDSMRKTAERAGVDIQPGYVREQQFLTAGTTIKPAVTPSRKKAGSTSSELSNTKPAAQLELNNNQPTDVGTRTPNHVEHSSLNTLPAESEARHDDSEIHNTDLVDASPTAKLNTNSSVQVGINASVCFRSLPLAS